MANMFRTIKIDRDKFIAWYKEAREKYDVKSAAEFADRIGYNHTFIANVKARGQLSVPSVKVLEAVYGLKLEDVMPDEVKPEPEKVETPETVDLSNLESMLKNTLHAVTEIQGMTDDLKKGFRVQTNPRMDSESIAEGVYAGMCRFWERNKKDIIGQLRGLVFAGTFDAGKKLDEMKTDTKIWPVAK